MFATARFAHWANVMLWTVGAWLVAFFFATLFQGWPVSQQWMRTGPLINCPRMYFALGVTDLALDIVVLCLPMPIIWGLHATRRKKLGVASIFGLGFLYVY